MNKWKLFDAVVDFLEEKGFDVGGWFYKAYEFFYDDIADKFLGLATRIFTKPCWGCGIEFGYGHRNDCPRVVDAEEVFKKLGH